VRDRPPAVEKARRIVSEQIQHLVLFHFPRGLSPDEEREMFDQVRPWYRDIGRFSRLRFGRDQSGRSRGYDYALLVEFDDRRALERYLPHRYTGRSRIGYTRGAPKRSSWTTASPRPRSRISRRLGFVLRARRSHEARNRSDG